MKAEFELTGVDEMVRRMREFERKATHAIHQVATYWKAVFESYAKDHAAWTDRTGNARQALFATVEPKRVAQSLAQDTVTLYLSHGMEYGIYLETRWRGRYAIIWPTIQAHMSEINRMLRRIFS